MMHRSEEGVIDVTWIHNFKLDHFKQYQGELSAFTPTKTRMQVASLPFSHTIF